MRILSAMEIAVIAGGDDGGSDEDEEQGGSGSSSGGASGGSGGVQSVTVPGSRADAQRAREDAARNSPGVDSICTTVTAGPISRQSCVNSDGTQSVQTCVNVGASANVGVVGGGASVNACNTKTVEAPRNRQNNR